jgi:hypothetical protein
VPDHSSGGTPRRTVTTVRVFVFHLVSVFAHRHGSDLPEVKVDCNAAVNYYPSSSAAAAAPHARELATDDAKAGGKYGPWTTIPTTHTIFIRNGGSHRDCPGSETLSIHSNFTYTDGTMNTVTGTDFINMGAVSGNVSSRFQIRTSHGSDVGIAYTD